MHSLKNWLILGGDDDTLSQRKAVACFFFFFFIISMKSKVLQCMCIYIEGKPQNLYGHECKNKNTFK